MAPSPLPLSLLTCPVLVVALQVPRGREGPPELFGSSGASQATTTAPTCIVGAGPGGLSLAWWLAQEGQDVVVFESAGHVGGALMSWADPATGRVHDVGANGIYPGYNLTYEFLRRFERPTQQVYSDKYEGRIRDMFHNYPKLMSFFVANVINGRCSKHRRTRSLTGSVRWRCGFEYGYGYQPEGPGKAVTHDRADLFFDSTLIAGHSLRWRPAPAKETVCESLLKFAGLYGSFLDLGRQVEGGFESLARAIADDLPDGSLRLNHSVDSIRRAGGVLQVGGAACGRVVVTGGAYKHLQRDVADAELAGIFARIRHVPYFTAIVDCGEAMLEPLGLSNDPYTAMFQQQWRDRYFTVFGYHNASHEEHITRGRMVEHMQHKGCAPGTVAFFKVWHEYFPHFVQADVDAGVLEAIERRQGEGGVYWAGTFMNFDIVEGAFAYSKHLFDRYLRRST